MAQWGYKLKHVMLQSVDVNTAVPQITEKVVLDASEICFENFADHVEECYNGLNPGADLAIEERGRLPARGRPFVRQARPGGSL